MNLFQQGVEGSSLSAHSAVNIRVAYKLGSVCLLAGEASAGSQAPDPGDDIGRGSGPVMLRPLNI